MSGTTSILKGATDRIWIKTEAKVRAEDGGTITVPFKLYCKRPTSAQIADIRERMHTGDVHDADIAREHVIDWQLPGADGEPLEFSADNLDILLDQPDYLKAVGTAMLELLFGPEVLKSKNSTSSGASGRNRR